MFIQRGFESCLPYSSIIFFFFLMRLLMESIGLQWSKAVCLKRVLVCMCVRVRQGYVVWRRTEAAVCEGCKARSVRHLVDKAKFVPPRTFHTEKMCFGGKCKICSFRAKKKMEEKAEAIATRRPYGQKPPRPVYWIFLFLFGPKWASLKLGGCSL